MAWLHREDLTEGQTAQLEQVYASCPRLGMAHRLKECVRHIFESDSTKEKALARLDKWTQIAQQEELFPAFHITLSNWSD